LSKLILGYCQLFPEAQAVLDGNQNYQDLVEIYHFSAEEWGKYQAEKKKELEGEG
jgi:hypothetical protein